MNAIASRQKSINRAEVCDQNFIEFVQAWPQQPPALSPQLTRGDAPILPGSLCTRRDFAELFESQLISRHLDLMARVLRV